MASVPGADRAMYVGIQGGRPSNEAGFTEAGSAEISSTIVYSKSGDQFVPAHYVNHAVKNINQVIAGFMNANGLCIVISSESCFGGTENVVTGIHQSGREFEKVFKMFGYATYHVPNPNCYDIKGLYRSLATQITYPKSYRRFVFFYTGHGYSDHISLDDGDISIYDMISNFWKSKAPDIADIPKIFIFDCCRMDNPDALVARRSNTSFDASASSNIYILYTTLPQSQSYARDGASIPTTGLVEILRDPNHDFQKLHISLHAKIKEACDHPDLRDAMNPVSQSALHETINFHQERKQPMKPTALQVRWGPVNTEIEWKEPAHARFQELTGYEICIQSNGVITQTNQVSKAQTTHSVPSSEVEKSEVHIQANYKDGTVVCSDQSSVKCSWTLNTICTRCIKNCSSWCLTSVVALIALLSFVALAATIVFVALEDRKTPVSTLIESGDIISHLLFRPSWQMTLWYSGFSLRIKNFPPSDDEPLNISIIKPGEAKVVITQSKLPDFYLSLYNISPTNEMYMFPRNYLSMPLCYFVQGSNIAFELFIQLPSPYNVFRSAEVYVFDFFENMPDQPTESTLSKALKVFDVTSASSKPFTFTYNVMKNSYLFFYIKMNTSVNFLTLHSNLMFLQRKFIFASNPPEKVLRNKLQTTKSTFVGFSMFSPPPPPPHGIHLYAHPAEDTEDVLSNHVTIQLEYRVWFQCVLALALLLLFIVFLFLFIVCCKYKYKHRHQNYTPLQNFSEAGPTHT